MAQPTRQMHLGVFAIGAGNHVAGWRFPGAGMSGEDLSIFQQIAQSAECGKFDFMFISDNVACLLDDLPGFVARLELLTLLSALAVTTKHLGLVATASSTYSQAYNLARLFASLDHISRGRAGWNVVTTSSVPSAANFGQDKPPPHDLRYEMAGEFVDVVKGLWDSWEDGARIADRETGVYLDHAKIHALNHVGRFQSVRGPLNCSRCPQGHPVIVQAGSSASGQDFAARIADIMFTIHQDLGEARAFYASMKERVARVGRSPDHCKIIMGYLPVVGRSETEARAKLDDLMKFIDHKSAMTVLSERFGHDMSQYPLDGPVPDLPATEIHSYTKVLIAMARRNNYRLRDIRDVMALSRGYLITCGTPAQIADTMEEWFTTGAADGFMLTPPYFPGAFDEFVDLVVPELQRRGRFRRDDHGTMLRDHLGLPIPVNRHTARKQQRVPV